VIDMAKEVLLYGEIRSYTATDFHQSLQAIGEDDEAVLRINSPGGSPEFGWGMVAMWKDKPNKKRVKVDGQAHSMAAFFLCYADSVESLDVAEFLIHRAAYPSWFEQSAEMFDQATKDNLIRVNKSLEAAFRGKVDVEKFEQMKGVKVKDVFSLNNRIDVYLTAKEAKSIGLIDKIVTITPSIRSEIEGFAKAASSNGERIFIPKEVIEQPINNKPTKPKQMTADQLKSEHPEVFNAIAKSAVDAERDRVGAWMAFNDIDAVAVAKGIESGASISQKDMAEFTRKGIAKGAVKAAESESTTTIVEGAEKTPEQLAAEAEAKTKADFLTAAKEAAKKLI
jgi:ATP-dependent protease ClpP protease subunit